MKKIILLLLLIPTVCFSQNSVLYNGKQEITNVEAYQLLREFGKEYLAFGAQKITKIGDEVVMLDYGDEIIAVGVGEKSTERREDDNYETESNYEEDLVNYNRQALERALKNERWLSAARYYHYLDDDESSIALLREHENEIVEANAKRSDGSIDEAVYNRNMYYLGFFYSCTLGDKERGEYWWRKEAKAEEERGAYNSAAATYHDLGDTANEERCKALARN